jgi:hypothetical protein
MVESVKKFACDGCLTVVSTPMPGCDCGVGLRPVLFWGLTVGIPQWALIGDDVSTAMVQAHTKGRQYRLDD